MPVNRSEINYAHAVQGTISGHIRQTTRQLTKRFVVAALVPLLVFVMLLLLSGYVRTWVAVTYQADSLNLTTAISTSLVVLVVSWFVLGQTEQRTRGWAALRRLMGVLGALTRLEAALQNPADQSELTLKADIAWGAYRRYVETLGLTLPPLDSSARS
jgi:uncharacterized membrane protein (DUF485 family)